MEKVYHTNDTTEEPKPPEIMSSALFKRLLLGPGASNVLEGISKKNTTWG